MYCRRWRHHTALRMTQEALQYTLFTGELVDNRTRAQKQQDKQRGLPQQTEMFSQRELAQYVNPHPIMDVSPGFLVLISEDPRTPEEKERDLQRAAERETYPLFPESTDSSDEVQVEPPQLVEVNPKENAYLKLVEVSKEQAVLLNPRPINQLEYALLLALTKQAAKEAGLTEAEVTAAVQVGNNLGKRDLQRLVDEKKPATQEKSPNRMSFEPDAYWLGRWFMHTLEPSRF